jgi:electron transfer flavoprotein alpha subunit
VSLSDAIPGRVRRDPRLAHRAPDRQASHAAPQACTGIDAEAAPVLEYAGGVLCLCGEMAADHWMAIGFARLMAGPDRAVLAVATTPADDLAEAGADAAWQLDLAREGAVDELAGTVCTLAFGAVVAAEGGASGHAARALAARLGWRLAANVVATREGAIIRLVDGGRTECEEPSPPIVVLAPGQGAAARAPRRTCIVFQPLRCADAPSPPLLRDLGPVRQDPMDMPLGEARVVLAGGGGLTAWSDLAAVALRLDAAIGASRVACDRGSAARHRQVGASGTLVGARLYVAFGVSGAIQHLQGIERCARVVAINTDPEAPIAGRADLTIVADADATVRALRARIEAAA